MFEKHIKCPLCHGAKRFRLGPGAIVKSEWDCFKCKGTGELIAHLGDRILLAIALKLDEMLQRYTRMR